MCDPQIQFEVFLFKRTHIQQMHTNKDNKISTQRNITPNYLKYKRKSSTKSGRPEDQGLDYQNPTERSGSKTSRCSFDVYQKRVLHLSKIKNTLALKAKESSVEPNKKRKEGLQVTSRRSTPNKAEDNQQELQIINLVASKKNSNNHSNKAIKLGNQSREKSQRNSNPKRSEESLQKEQQRAKIQNKQLINTLMQHQFPPNYMSKLKIKKMEQKEQKQMKQQKETREKREEREQREKIKLVSPQQKKFLKVDLQMKGQEELRNYQVYEQLGKGAYGVVKMGLNKRTNQKVAIKIYEKRRLDQPNKLKNLQRQINILAKLSHPVIARLIDAIEGTNEIFLIQEYGGANSLYNYLLSKPQHRLQEQEAKQFFKTIAETLKYLHKRNIVHRDIKAQNILLNRNKQLKLIDFGFSLQSVPPSTIDTFCGTPTYMAPQIVSKKDHVPIYTDLWSLGVFLFVILQGNYPFRAKHESDLFQKIRKGQFEYIHKDISQKSRHVIQRLIRVNPLQRMSTQDMNESFWQWYLNDTGKSYIGDNTTATNMTTYSI